VKSVLRAFSVMCTLLGVFSPYVHAQKTAPINTKTEKATKKSDAALQEAQKAGIPTKFGDWQLVRYITGEHAHFLYANGKRSFSLFLLDTQDTRPLKEQKGWKRVVGTGNLIALVHQDARDTTQSALVFKFQKQRRMIVGKLSEAELVAVARLLR
jgi:hypothetical protein